jgi:hypothetical protein
LSPQATGGDQQMLDMLVEATASREAADRWRWKNADAALCAAVVETEASGQSTVSSATLFHHLLMPPGCRDSMLPGLGGNNITRLAMSPKKSASMWLHCLLQWRKLLAAKSIIEKLVQQVDVLPCFLMTMSSANCDSLLSHGLARMRPLHRPDRQGELQRWQGFC